jgi:hypothetical protein
VFDALRDEDLDAVARFTGEVLRRLEPR